MLHVEMCNIPDRNKSRHVQPIADKVVQNLEILKTFQFRTRRTRIFIINARIFMGFIINARLLYGTNRKFSTRILVVVDKVFEIILRCCASLSAIICRNESREMQDSHTPM